MEVISLISGGKDSYLSILHCIAAGHKVVALANLYPPHSGSTDEVSEHLPAPTIPTEDIVLETSMEGNEDLDSFMYQTVGHQVLPLYATLLDVPLYRKAIQGRSENQDLVYTQTEGQKDETEDLYKLLEHIKKKFPGVQAVCSGAILSNYQRTRVENVVSRLGLVSLAPLWERPQLQVLKDLGIAGVDARTIKVAAVGLGERWLWRNVGDMTVRTYLKGLREKFGVHPAGEGGEFETLVIDGPGFRARLECEVEKVMRGDVGYVNVRSVRMVDKGGIRLPGLRKEDCGIVSEELLEPGFKRVLGLLAPWDESLSQSPAGNMTVTKVPALTISSTPHHVTISNIAFTSMDPADFKFQMDNLLSDNHLHPSQITSTLLLLPSMSLFTPVNTLYSSLFTISPPSRTCIAISPNLLPASFLLSFTALRSPSDRNTLHIQSHSHWAPACIGPYSQAVKTPFGAELAGQIGLLPFSGQLYDGPDKRVEILLALQNFSRVARRMQGEDMPDIKEEEFDYEEEEDGDKLVQFPPFQSITAYCDSSASKEVLVDIWRKVRPGMPLIIAQVYELPRMASAEFHAVLPGPRARMETFWTRMETDEEGVGIKGAEHEVTGKYLEDATVFVDASSGEWEDGRVVSCLRVWLVDGQGEKVVAVKRAGWRRIVVEQVNEDEDSD